MHPSRRRDIKRQPLSGDDKRNTSASKPPHEINRASQANATKTQVSRDRKNVPIACNSSRAVPRYQRSGFATTVVCMLSFRRSFKQQGTCCKPSRSETLAFPPHLPEYAAAKRLALQRW